MILASGSFPQVQSPIYFDRTEVKKAIHAPLDVNWEECSEIDVFVGRGDASLPPAFTVLPSVIEKSNRSVIVHGLADYILIAEGYATFYYLLVVVQLNSFSLVCRTRIVIQK